MTYPQVSNDTLYRVELFVTGSTLFTFFENPRYPEADENAALGYGFFIRPMWHPGRLLAVGLMTGYCQISEDKFYDSDGNTASARLTAVPLQLTVSMHGQNFEIGLGIGPYLMQTTINYISTSRGERYELGVTFFSSYVFSISENIFIGPELKLLYMSYRGLLSFIPSISIRYSVFEY